AANGEHEDWWCTRTRTLDPLIKSPLRTTIYQWWFSEFAIRSPLYASMVCTASENRLAGDLQAHDPSRQSGGAATAGARRALYQPCAITGADPGFGHDPVALAAEPENLFPCSSSTRRRRAELLAASRCVRLDEGSRISPIG